MLRYAFSTLNRVRHPSKCWRNQLLAAEDSHAVLWGLTSARVQEGNLVNFHSPHLPRLASSRSRSRKTNRNNDLDDLDDVEKDAARHRTIKPRTHSAFCTYRSSLFPSPYLCGNTIRSLSTYRYSISLSDWATLVALGAVLVAREVTLSRIAKRAKSKTHHFGRHCNARFVNLHFDRSAKTPLKKKSQARPHEAGPLNTLGVILVRMTKL